MSIDKDEQKELDGQGHLPLDEQVDSLTSINEEFNANDLIEEFNKAVIEDLKSSFLALKDKFNESKDKASIIVSKPHPPVAKPPSAFYDIYDKKKLPFKRKIEKKINKPIGGIIDIEENYRDGIKFDGIKYAGSELTDGSEPTVETTNDNMNKIKKEKVKEDLKNYDGYFFAPYIPELNIISSDNRAIKAVFDYKNRTSSRQLCLYANGLYLYFFYRNDSNEFPYTIYLKDNKHKVEFGFIGNDLLTINLLKLCRFKYDFNNSDLCYHSVTNPCHSMIVKRFKHIITISMYDESKTPYADWIFEYSTSGGGSCKVSFRYVNFPYFVSGRLKNIFVNSTDFVSRKTKKVK